MNNEWNLEHFHKTKNEIETLNMCYDIECIMKKWHSLGKEQEQAKLNGTIGSETRKNKENGMERETGEQDGTKWNTMDSEWNWIAKIATKLTDWY